MYKALHVQFQTLFCSNWESSWRSTTDNICIDSICIPGRDPGNRLMTDYDTTVDVAEDICCCELGVIIDAIDETKCGFNNHDKSQIIIMGNENVSDTLHTCQRGDRPIKSDNDSCFTTVRTKSLDPFTSTDGACTASKLTQRDKLVGVPSLVGSHNNTNTVILKSLNHQNALQTDGIVPITSSTLQTGSYTVHTVFILHSAYHEVLRNCYSI